MAPNLMKPMPARGLWISSRSTWRVVGGMLTPSKGNAGGSSRTSERRSSGWRCASSRLPKPPGDEWPTRWTGARSSAVMNDARSSTNVSSVIPSSGSSFRFGQAPRQLRAMVLRLAANAGTWRSHSR
jgi:hypothetical protein